MGIFIDIPFFLNELLSREKIHIENSNQKNEQLLLDAAKASEKKNKAIWSSMWAILFISMIALLAGIFVARFLYRKGCGRR